MSLDDRDAASHRRQLCQWVRPPNIQLKGVQIPSSNAVSVTSTSELSIKFNLDIS